MTKCVCVYFDDFMLSITLFRSLLISLFLVTARFMQCCSFSADSEVPPKIKFKKFSFQIIQTHRTFTDIRKEQKLI